MLEYFGNIKTRRDAQTTCDLLLVQGNRTAIAEQDEKIWKKTWEGSRSSDKNERFQLFQRVKVCRDD